MLLLLVILFVSAIQTYQGRQAARDHQATVERLLRDHAALAAWRYAQQSKADLHSVWKGLYTETKAIENTFDPSRFAPMRLPSTYLEQCSTCDPEPYIEYHFAYDYSKDRFFWAKGEASEAEANALRRLLRTDSIFAKFLTGSQATVAGSEMLGRQALAVLIRHAEPVGNDFAIGFVGRPQVLTVMFTPIADFNVQMPTSEPTPDRFAIVVRDGPTVLLDGDIPASKFAGEATMGPQFGNLQVEVSVNPRDVPLIAGTVPRFRVQLFIALMALSALLILAVIMLFRREADLAQARSDFVAGVSHELRTPLAQIRMFTETLLLGRTRNDAERRRSLEIIDQEARRLTALVDNVLQLGRVERGAARLAPAATQLAPLVKDVVDTFSQLPRARSIDFRTELEPRLIATVDAGAFRQILLNLLDNAVKYGKVGQRVVVGLAMFEENARLWVDDEGQGIPARERERIFEPFYRSNHSETRASGSGIGLAVVRELSLLLGGRVYATDAPGGGARFVVEFPEAYLRAEEAISSTAVA